MPRSAHRDLNPRGIDRANERYHVPNLGRALLILEHLAKAPEPQGVSEIADKLDLPKNSAFRILTTLHAYGYLNRDQATKTYALHSKLLTLGYAAVREGGLVESSLDVLRQVRDDTDETALVGIIDGHEGVILEQVLSQQQVRVMLAVGTRFPLHTAAPAKAYLAHLRDDLLDALLDRITFTRHTEHTVTDRSAFIDQLVQARRDGYAVDNGEHNIGIRCVGAAVLNHRTDPIGCIWITAPSFRVPPDRFASIGRTLAQAATRISARFGYTGS